MSKIAVIPLGHEDYKGESLTLLLNETEKRLADAGIVYPGIQTVATTSESAVSLCREARCEGFDGFVLFLASWIECRVVMSALLELEGLPVMLWGTTMIEVGGKNVNTGSYVSAAMLSGVVKRLALPCKCLIGSCQDPGTIGEILTFAKVSSAIKALRYSTVGLIGYTSMGIYTGTFDHLFMRYHIGPEIDHMDAYTLINYAQKYGAEAISNAENELRAVARLNEKIDKAAVGRTLALYLAMKEICGEYKWDALNIKCQYELSKEYKTVPCVAISLLADQGIITSCEGDMLITVSMMILRYISGQTVTYGDAINHYKDTNTVKFSACGFLPFSMGAGERLVRNFMEHPGFSGIQTSFVMRPERVTFLRLVEDTGSYHLVYGTGQGLQTGLRDGCMPALDVRLDGKLEDFVSAYAGQHYAICYGDCSAELEMFAGLKGIKTVRV